MNSMIETIEKEFSYLDNTGYARGYEDLTHVVKYIIYAKENIKIIFYCELMEYYFDFEIWYTHDGKEYSVCEHCGRQKLFYENRKNENIIHQSVFEYTMGIWDKSLFQQGKEILFHKKYGFFNRKEKLFLASVDLYKSLLGPVISAIEKIIETK